MQTYRHLFELINDNFNYDELTLLCQSLGVDIEELSGGFNRKRKAMELQEYMRRRNRTGELLQEINRERPHLDLRPFVRAEPEEKVETSAIETPEPTPVGQDYENFDIHIGTRREDGRYPLTVNSPAGETAGSIWQTLPLEEEAFSDVVYYLRELMAKPEDAEQFGRQLHTFLFPGPILSLYDRSMAKVLAEGKKGLRIRLHISLESVPELSQIPWEYCASNRTYLAVDEATPIVRYIPTDRAPASVAVPETVRILVVMASPKGQPLDIDAERQRIQQALSPLETQGQVKVAIVSHATRLKLFENFSTFNPHILHFMGHGALSDDGEGTLILENELGEADAVDASKMLVLLQNSSVRLVVLSACETAATSEGKALMGVAPRLVWAGIPAVIAMQTVIPDTIAIVFMQYLYSALAQGKPLDTAMTTARKGAHFVNDEIYWAIPVLFMRAPDGVIWQPQ